MKANPVVCCKALLDGPNSYILDAPVSEMIPTLAQECASVGAAMGLASISDARGVHDAVVRVAEATAGNTSSMLADIRRGDLTEIDTINGISYVVLPT